MNRQVPTVIITKLKSNKPFSNFSYHRHAALAWLYRIFKYRWPCALASEELLDTLLLQVHLRKEHMHKCRKMGSSFRDPLSTVSTTSTSSFWQKRDIVKSVWDEYVKEERVTVKALPCKSHPKIHHQRGSMTTSVTEKPTASIKYTNRKVTN